MLFIIQCSTLTYTISHRYYDSDYWITRASKLEFNLFPWPFLKAVGLLRLLLAEHSSPVRANKGRRMHLESCRMKHCGFIGGFMLQRQKRSRHMKLCIPFLITATPSTRWISALKYFSWISAKNNLKPVMKTYLTSIVKVEGINNKAPLCHIKLCFCR